MPILALSIGSNQDAAAHIRRAVTALRQHFMSLRCSTVYESEAVGFDGDNFLNLVALTSTEDDLGEIATYLKDLEDELGRDRSLPKFAARRIDIDILCYGDEDGQQHGLKLRRSDRECLRAAAFGRSDAGGSTRAYREILRPALGRVRPFPAGFVASGV